ncbi:MAG TPA: FkbM family methyltransferase [Verrucomicrobiae bacterium]
MRSGFLKGAWRHIANVPRLVVVVRGWPWLVADCMGLRRQPYQLRTRGGACCELRPGTSDWWIFLEVFVFGIYKRVENDIRRSKVIIDIGANVGFFAVYASSINPAVEIHVFEPFPKNLDQLKRNLLLNKNRRVHVHPEAVSDKTGVATLYFTPGDDSGCSLNQPKGQSCSVNVVGVNDLLSLCGIEKCDLLKMDCEGSELSILKALSSGDLAKIGAVIMEYHLPEELDSLTGILSRSGFKCELFEQIHTLYAHRN